MYQPLTADGVALVVIDLQERLMGAIENRDEVVRNAGLLIRLSDVEGLPRIVTTQYAKGIGPVVAPIAELLGEGQALLDKTEFSCLANDAIAAEVENVGRKRLVLTGVETHICVYQTATAAVNAGYEVTVAADAVGSRTRANRRMGLTRLRELGVHVVSTEMVIYELLRKAGTPQFKNVADLLKD